MGTKLLKKMMQGELPLPKVALTLGAKIIETAEELGTITIEYNGKTDFANPAGNIQGGILAAMLDDTMSLALLSMLNDNEFAPTLELKINFIAPAKVGRIVGYGEVVSKGNRVCVLMGELWQAGKLVARSSATTLIQKNRS